MLSLMKLKTQLQYFLRLRGMTASELARRSGVPKQSISDWMAGTPPRRIDQVKKVSGILGTSVDNLCFGEGEDPANSNVADLDTLIGDGWLGGLFEVRLRRVKK